MTANPQRPELHLRLSGPFHATDARGREVEGLSRRAQALLAFLSQQPGMRAERTRLADLLWSDRGEDQARASLRQELSVLRRSLPDALLEANRQQVWLDPARIACEAGGNAPFLDGFDLASEGFEDWLREARSQPPADLSVPSVPQVMNRPAVLLFCFEALSGGRDDGMIAAGLAADLRTTLSYWRWFPVIGPEAIGWKTAREVDLREAASCVDAAFAISGTLRCLGGRVKITAELTEAATGRLRWSNTFTGDLGDIFQFQEEVSQAIVAQIEPQITRAEAMRITRMRPASLGPWQLLARADEIDRTGGEGYGTPESNFEQARLMEEALSRDPGFAPALSRLARVHFRSALLGWTDDPDASYRLCEDFARRALDCDPDNWESHAYYGLVHVFAKHEYAAGRFHAEEAVRLNPSAALGHQALACALEWIGEPEAALSHLNLIFRLDPGYKSRAAVFGAITTCEMFCNRREPSLEAARRLVSIAPDYARGLQRCVASFGYFGEPDRAARALEQLRRLQPDFDAAYIKRTYPYARPDHLGMLLKGFERCGAFDLPD